MQRYKKKKIEEKELKVSFISKKEYACPVCDSRFHKEELLSGGGRLIAGALTDELHRLYDPSAKYGKIYPLAYMIVVCPDCWYAAMESDFPNLPESSAEKAFEDRDGRVSDTLLILPYTDFDQPRGLMEGAASQYLALRCYDYFKKDSSPTIKQGLASLRTAWLMDDLDKVYPNQHYNWLATLFRKKAEYFYNEALAREMAGAETLSGLSAFGPDTDKNYSYEGMLYLCAYLRFKYGPSATPEDRKKTLQEASRTIAKLFGMGKSSKDKPGAFLDLAKKTYAAINEELETIQT